MKIQHILFKERQNRLLSSRPSPAHFKYEYLEDNSKPIIISSSLIGEMEEQLLGVLRKHKKTIAWAISHIKGLSPSIVMHKILMEDNRKPKVQTQRRLNPFMQYGVRKEAIKLLAAGIIYLISDSRLA